MGRRRRGRARARGGAPFQTTVDQWSGMGKGSSTIACTITGSATSDAMCKVRWGRLQITSSAPIRAQLVLRGYGPEDEIISSRPIVTSGSTASTRIRSPPHTAWTANAESNHLAWLRVDATDDSVTWAYVVMLSYQKVPNNTLVQSGAVTLVENRR